MYSFFFDAWTTILTIIFICDYASPGLFKSGTSVAGGSYIVPEGVAVEELKNYDGHKRLKDKCPPDVHKLLASKDLFNTYDQFVQAVYDTKETRGFWGKWKGEH